MTGKGTEIAFFRPRKLLRNMFGNQSNFLILHAHIPRTAGTSVSRVFQKSFDTLHLNHYHSDPNYILGPRRLAALLEINPWLRSISSHHLRSFPYRVEQNKTVCVTFLREPTLAFLSFLNYARREYHNLPPETRGWWPEETPKMSLRELAAVYLDQIENSGDTSFQTRFFCPTALMSRQGLTDNNDYGVNCYEIAELILSQFALVGIVEEIKKSVALLHARLRSTGVAIDPRGIRRENKSRLQSRIPWLNANDEVGGKVLACNRNDRRLYSRYKEALLADYWNLRRHNSFTVPGSNDMVYETIEDWAIAKYLEKRELGTLEPDTTTSVWRAD
jgi:hypothetical protein